MPKRTHVVMMLLVVVALAACGPQATPTPTVTPTPIPTDTPLPTATPEPTATFTPAPTPFPTPAEVAPEETFTFVGSVAKLSGSHGISGKATVAGLQTLIIQSFYFDGKGPKADVRLVKGQDYQDSAVILLELAQQSHENEVVLMHVPASVESGSVDTIVIYCPETDEVYAEAQFD